jgi:hypothetical protein
MSLIPCWFGFDALAKVVIEVHHILMGEILERLDFPKIHKTTEKGIVIFNDVERRINTPQFFPDKVDYRLFRPVLVGFVPILDILQSLALIREHEGLNLPVYSPRFLCDLYRGVVVTTCESGLVGKLGLE